MVAIQLVMDHVEDNHWVDGDYSGIEDDWIMTCPEENCGWDWAWEDDCLPMAIPEQELYNEYVQFTLVHLDIHRQLMHDREERLDDGTSRFDSALWDQCIILDTFPKIGQFGGNVESDDDVCSFDTDGVFLPAQSHMPLQAAKEQSETSREDKNLPGHIVEMDVGSSNFDSGDKYWPAQSHM